MPLRCLDKFGASIHAFDLKSEDWDDLANRNRRDRHLRMSCCSAQATLRRSSRGTQFFAHKAVGACETAPETEVHLRLKQIAVEAARAHGWTAETEVAGVSPSDERWQADVLATRNGVRVAVEIQWSNQTSDETLRRQERYRQSGIRCLWISRTAKLPVAKELPVAYIADKGGEPLRVQLSSGQMMPVDQFLDAAFGGRFKFGVPPGIPAMVSVRAGPIQCWHDSCRARTTIVTGVDVEFGPNVCEFGVDDLDAYPALFEVIRGHLPRDQQIGAIKPRFSNTRGRSYLSNGCYRCDRIIGAFYTHDACEEQDVVCAFPIRLSEPWQQAIDQYYGYDDSWVVYPPDDRP